MPETNIPKSKICSDAVFAFSLESFTPLYTWQVWVCVCTGPELWLGLACLWGCKVGLVAFVGLFSSVCFQMCPQMPTVYWSRVVTKLPSSRVITSTDSDSDQSASFIHPPMQWTSSPIPRQTKQSFTGTNLSWKGIIFGIFFPFLLFPKN